MNKIYVCCIPGRDFELDIIKDDPLREYIDPRGGPFDASIVGEIAALYKVINNHKDDDIIGLEQYRRIFWEGDKPLGLEKIKSILNKNDIITTFDDLMSNYLTHFIRFCSQNPTLEVVFSKWISFLQNNYSEELANNFLSYLRSITKSSTRNMVIARANIIKDYLDWFAPKLVAFYNILKDTCPDLELSRALGYITELVFGFYIRDIAKLRHAYVPYFFFEKGTDF